MNPIVVFLAQILAPVYIVAGILLLFRASLYDRVIDDFKKSPALSYFTGICVLVIGTVWLLALFSFTSFAEAVFTIIGIVAVLKGILLILFPATLYKMTCKCPGLKIVGGIIGLVFGAWCLSLGYGLF